MSNFKNILEETDDLKNYQIKRFYVPLHWVLNIYDILFRKNYFLVGYAVFVFLHFNHFT